MEHNIKKMFENEDFEKKELPQSHREEFLNKLKKSSTQKNKKNNYFIYKIASILMVFGVLFYLTIHIDESKEKPASILVQIENIEKVYVEEIDKEWESFVKITNDAVLINKYEEKLRQSSLDYKNLTHDLQKNPNNIMVLESLIENLQRRLELLKGIQEHIKELNQKNTSNETIYI
ncbi:hypothetical protein [Polaribacter aestuariivivens]|uniref:hypothetical protein n=1 Tax=Polaribacter aestuariivivens TaxID=2304626 RepID=UPI003F499B26